ncbi:hypothetical protein ACIOYV_01810 [Pseudomonas sp. NPDC087342]|uniref:hypothetical protein n=1 Tax=Pseudomonas sp. NPDC087342 TaxID=3364437 RepID=UPI00382348A1
MSTQQIIPESKFTALKRSMRRVFSIKPLELHNAYFFIPLGFLSGLMIEGASLLPEKVQQNMMTDVIGDHIAIKTIAMLILLQFTAVSIILKLSPGKRADYFQHLNDVFSNKVAQLCSPAAFVLIGVAGTAILLGAAQYCLTIIGLRKPVDIQYFSTAASFLYLTLWFFGFHFISRAISEILHAPRSLTLVLGGGFISISPIAAVLISPFIGSGPVTIQVKFETHEYEAVAAAAAESAISPPTFVLRAAINSASDVSHEASKVQELSQ